MIREKSPHSEHTRVLEKPLVCFKEDLERWGVILFLTKYNVVVFLYVHNKTFCMYVCMLTNIPRNTIRTAIKLKPLSSIKP